MSSRAGCCGAGAIRQLTNSTDSPQASGNAGYTVSTRPRRRLLHDVSSSASHVRSSSLASKRNNCLLPGGGEGPGTETGLARVAVKNTHPCLCTSFGRIKSLAHRFAAAKCFFYLTCRTRDVPGRRAPAYACGSSADVSASLVPPQHALRGMTSKAYLDDTIFVL